MEQEPKKNQLQKMNLTPSNFDEVARMSKLFYDSGMFNDLQSASQAGVKILAGAELGISPFQAISGVHIIKGKPTIGAGIMASMLDTHPEYDFEVLEQTDKVCSIKFFKNGKAKGTSTFTIEDAQKAGTQNINKFPANMLYARAMSNGVKWYAPGLFSGPVYVPEEMIQDAEVQTTYEEVKPVEQPKTETIQDAVIVEEPVKWATEKQKELIRNLVRSHHISDAYRQSVQGIESNYEGEFPLTEFERVYAEVTLQIAKGGEYEKTTPATADLITDIEIKLDNAAFTETERLKGLEKLAKGYSIAQAQAVLKKLDDMITERSNLKVS